MKVTGGLTEPLGNRPTKRSCMPEAASFIIVAVRACMHAC
jgi:hypothetical protein